MAKFPSLATSRFAKKYCEALVGSSVNPIRCSESELEYTSLV